MTHDIVRRPPPQDQADGLRRLFARAQARYLPVVANAHIGFGGVLLERICTALGAIGAHTLVVDACERAPRPKELAVMELADGVEPLSADVSYLAARGLPLLFVDTHGSTTKFLQAAAEACPRADVVLVHAGATDLCRMFGKADRTRCAPPLVLADEHPASVTHAYSNIKLLSQRGGHQVQDLLLGAAGHSRRADRIIRQLTRCADDFLGAALRDTLRIDPAGHAQEAISEALVAWAWKVARPQTDQPVPNTPVGSAWSSAVARAYRATDAAMALN
jgi:flagellar biosynthesis protein FlhG